MKSNRNTIESSSPPPSQLCGLFICEWSANSQLTYSTVHSHFHFWSLCYPQKDRNKWNDGHNVKCMNCWGTNIGIGRCKRPISIQSSMRIEWKWFIKVNENPWISVQLQFRWCDVNEKVIVSRVDTSGFDCALSAPFWLRNDNRHEQEIGRESSKNF